MAHSTAPPPAWPPRPRSNAGQGSRPPLPRPRPQEYEKRYPTSKKAIDGVYHCLVGTNFASAVGHETRFFIHMQVDLLHIVLWKSRDSPFDGDAHLGKKGAETEAPAEAEGA